MTTTTKRQEDDAVAIDQIIAHLLEHWNDVDADGEPIEYVRASWIGYALGMDAGRVGKLVSGRFRLHPDPRRGYRMESLKDAIESVLWP